MSAHEPSVKAKVLAFVTSSQKALAAFIGAAGALASANLVPAPYGDYLATVLVIATGIVTYVLPYVKQVVETGKFEGPVDGIPASQLIAEHEAEVAQEAAESPADAVVAPAPTEDTPDDSGPATVAMPVEDLLAALHADTTEIPVQ